MIRFATHCVTWPYHTTRQPPGEEITIDIIMEVTLAIISGMKYTNENYFGNMEGCHHPPCIIQRVHNSHGEIRYQKSYTRSHIDHISLSHFRFGKSTVSSFLHNETNITEVSEKISTFAWNIQNWWRLIQREKGDGFMRNEK